VEESASVIFNKVAEENNRRIGEKLPKLATLNLQIMDVAKRCA
jgi:hypothetical protein